MPDVVVVPSSYILFLSRLLADHKYILYMLCLLDVYRANEKTYITCTNIKYTEKTDIYKSR
jgi:hypothetical protein